MELNIASDAPVYVAGHTGLVGSAVVRRLRRGGFTNILSATQEQRWKMLSPSYITSGAADYRREIHSVDFQAAAPRRSQLTISLGLCN